MDNQQIMREAANQQHMMNQRQTNQPVHEEYQQEPQQEDPVQPGPTASEMNDNLISSVNIPQRQPQQLMPHQPAMNESVSQSEPATKSSSSFNMVELLFEPVLLTLLLMIFFHPTAVSALKLNNYLGSLADENSFTLNLTKRILALVVIFFVVRQIYFYFFKKN